jgi:Xaa-Pro aminopeptidase
VTRATAEQALASALSRRRAAASAAWDLDDEIVLVGAGNRVAIPGRCDRTYPFRAHSEYLYLTDRERPGGVLAFDPKEGWTEFLSPVTRAELLWEALEGASEGVPEGARSALELEAWLDARQGRRCGCLGTPIERVECDPLLTEDLRDALTALRRVKDDVELERMRGAEQATRAGFLALPALIDQGRTEREIQIELEAEFFRHGADFLAFDTIVAAGPHSATLHFAPSSHRLAPGELLLVDAGGEVRGYASDVTRTYPVSGAFTADQAPLYEIVREALRVATASCRPGAEWRDVHLAAALVIGEGLVGLDLLRGEPASLFERGAITLFFPHGVGHMVGLGIRDAGGAVPDRPPPGDGFPRLRVDLPLRAGYAMTVEPGIYFVAPLLNEQETRTRLRDCVSWDKVDHFLGFGGMRLEDDVLVTEEGCEVMTRDIPFVG